MIGLSRTNNSVEGHHNIFNSLFTDPHGPRVSKVLERIVEEDSRWKTVVDEYIVSPADGIRGRGTYRDPNYIANDANLLALYNNQANNWMHLPNQYLRGIAHHL